MKFFSKVIFICNCCFILSVLLRYVELQSASSKKISEALGFAPLKSSLIVLGYGAVIFNFIFLLLFLTWIIFNRKNNVPIFILTFNLLLFIFQLIYFLF
jgi:hypothetical protein